MHRLISKRKALEVSKRHGQLDRYGNRLARLRIAKILCLDIKRCIVKARYLGFLLCAGRNQRGAQLYIFCWQVALVDDPQLTSHSQRGKTDAGLFRDEVDAETRL